MHYLKINATTQGAPATLEDEKVDLDGRYKGFRVLKGESFDGGYEVTFEYRNSDLKRAVGYSSLRTVDGKTYDCFLSAGYNGMDTVREAKALCASLKPYRAPAAGPDRETAAR